MSLLLETIRFSKGVFDNLALHQQRVERSCRELFGSEESAFSLEEVLFRFIENHSYDSHTLYKCRVVYGVKVKWVELIPYHMPEIHSVKLVTDNAIDYHLKYLDRKAIRLLYDQRGSCSDVLIIRKGLITDVSFANVIFFNGKEWLTPAFPLLKGTRREQLLQQEKIHTAEIGPTDFPLFEKMRIINAMIRFEDKIEIEVKKESFLGTDSV